MLDINATNPLITFVVLWILVLILGKVFFRPFQRIRAERAARIEADREASRRALEQNTRSLHDVDQAVKAARVAASKIREDLEVEALKEKTRLLNEVGAAARAEVDAARAELAGELDGLKARLQAQAENLAEAIEKRLLQ
jgi:F0F1-type ATP synthase membrane subunit b/b'